MNLKALEHIRRQRKMSLEYVAQKLGVDKSTYFRIEKGSINLKASMIPDLAKIYGVSAIELSQALFSGEMVA